METGESGKKWIQLESYLESFKVELSNSSINANIMLESYLESFKVDLLVITYFVSIVLESYLESFKD